MVSCPTTSAIRKRRESCANRPSPFAAPRDARPSRRVAAARAEASNEAAEVSAATRSRARCHRGRPGARPGPNSSRRARGEDQAARGLAALMLDTGASGGGAMTSAQLYLKIAALEPGGLVGRLHRRARLHVVPLHTAGLDGRAGAQQSPRLPKPSAIVTRQRARSRRSADEIESARRDAQLIAQRGGRDASSTSAKHVLKSATDAGERALSQTPAASSIERAPRRARGCATTWWRPPFASLATTRPATRRSARLDARFVDELTRVARGGRAWLTETLARRYAVAMPRSLARDQNVVERVGDDLAAGARAIGENRWSPISSSLRSSTGARRSACSRTLRGARPYDRAALAASARAASAASGCSRAIVAEYRTLERAARGMETLTVQSARPLDRAEYAKLIARLETRLRQKIRGYRDRRSGADRRARVRRWATAASTQPSPAASTTLARELAHTT